MSTKNDYSDQEWKAIAGAPVAAGLFISLSDQSGPVGIAKEAMAVGKAITESALGDAPEIVKSLAESVTNGGGRPELPDIPTGDRAQTKNALVGAIRTAVGTVEKKSPGELEGFKAWLASMAANVAQASKEGGFLGMGGTLVSGHEQQALRQLADVLGVNAHGSKEVAMSELWDKTKGAAGDAAKAVAGGTKAAVSAAGGAVEKAADVTAGAARKVGGAAAKAGGAALDKAGDVAAKAADLSAEAAKATVETAKDVGKTVGKKAIK